MVSEQDLFDEKAAYHYEPCDVYEAPEIDLDLPEILLVEFDYNSIVPSLENITFDLEI